jgi:hypothetical protein
MSKTATKVVIIALALLTTCVGGGYYLAKRFVFPMVEEAQVAVKDAREFARSSDYAGCVTEAPARYPTDSGSLKGAMKSMAFLSACLSQSTPTPGFCDDVPAPSDAAKGKEWLKARCSGRDLAQCTMIHTAVQSFCGSRKTG